MNALKKNENRIINLILAKNIIYCLALIIVLELLLFPLPIWANEVKIADQANVVNQEKKLTVELHQTYQVKERGVLSLSREELVNRNKSKYIKNGVVFHWDSAEREFLPQNKVKIKDSSVHLMTAYNSEVAQCDDSPCITANGFNVCEHGIEDTVAANFLPFGTKIRIPELFGDRVFIVRDRMHNRFSDRVDVWMLEKTNAKNFGVQIATIEVIE